MKVFLEVGHQAPLHQTSESHSPVSGMQYGVRMTGWRGYIGAALVADDGEIYADAYNPLERKSNAVELAVDPEALQQVDPEEIALGAVALALYPSAKREAALLVLLGEDGFTDI